MARQIFVVVFTLLLIQSCVKGPSLIEELPKPPPPIPTPDFVFSVGTIPAQSTVTFTNKTLNGDTYLWEFGDGETSSEQNPVHFYQNGGTYNVKLTSYNVSGSKSIERAVSVSKPYTSAVIKSIKLNNYYPLVIYDINSDPDVYLVVKDGASSISNRSNAYVDLPTNTVVTYNFNNKFIVSPLSKKISLEFWDADNPPSDPDDLMDKFDFVPLNYTTPPNAFPTSIRYAKDVDILIELEWE